MNEWMTEKNVCECEYWLYTHSPSQVEMKYGIN